MGGYTSGTAPVSSSYTGKLPKCVAGVSIGGYEQHGGYGGGAFGVLGGDGLDVGAGGDVMVSAAAR